MIARMLRKVHLLHNGLSHPKKEDTGALATFKAGSYPG